jgi:hypothetical protein
MPSQTRRSSRLRSSAAKKIQKRFRGKQTRKQVNKLRSSRKIQSRVRGRQTRKVINREKNTSTTINDCPICFEPLTNDVRIALPCGHRFHEACIRQSLTSTSGRCPKCRAAVTNINYPSIQQIQAQAQVQAQAQAQVQAQIQAQAILDPIIRRQYILQRLREIEMLQQRLAQLYNLLDTPNITINEALPIQHNARQIVRELRTIFYEASENYQNYRNVRIDGNPVDQDVINMYYITSDLYNRAQVLRNNVTRIVDELGDDDYDETPDLM